jgi:DNA segregation ATPase FtsK/SpoIIIE, S-DNA-T family
MRGLNPHSGDFITHLASIVGDYRRGMALIDGEFDQACENIGRSLARVRGQAAMGLGRSQDEVSEEMRLRKQSALIERDISKADHDIAILEKGIVAVDSAIRSLALEKADLEQQIESRLLIEKLFYLFLEDRNRVQCARLTRDLDNQLHERAALEKTRRGLEHARLQAASSKDSQQKELEKVRQRLVALKRLSEHADAQEQRLAEQGREAEARRQSRKRKLLKRMSDTWDDATREIRGAAERARKQQPAFAEFLESAIPLASDLPGSLLLGVQEVSFRGGQCQIPHAIQFPIDHALVLPEDNEAQRRLAHHILLRLLQAIPPGRLELSLIDPVKQGQSFGPFLPLLNVERLMPEQRVLTRADEIERVLGVLVDETESLIQRRFKGKISNWGEYNAVNADDPLSYKVVLLFNVPEQLSDRSSWCLERLIENGPRCGILPIVALDSRRTEDRRHEKLNETIINSTKSLEALLRVSDKDTRELSVTYHPEEWPRGDVLDGFLSRLAEKYVDSGRFTRLLQDLWVGYAKGDTTVNGFDVPIGWTPEGDVVSLTLGATNSAHHALLAGKTGSGKSNLLHVIIHSLCEKYAPKEVDLYLLDYKESTEFTVYANPKLPHARLVATESDPEYGVTVLQHLVNELENRARLFKSADVRDFVAYRNSRDTRLPRVLLVIDEFQVLFSEGRQIAECAEKMLAQLLKQGRSFGIHILLATQTLKGMKDTYSLGGLITQLGCRIALACGQEDSAMILGANNLAAAELKSPPEGIINNTNGAKSGNIKLMIPLAEQAFCRTHLRKVSGRATRRGIESKARVFNGTKLPGRMTFGDSHAIGGKDNSLLLGERLTFTADALYVPLVNRQAFNVLFCGYDDVIHDGLLVSVLAGISSAGEFEEIVYFNGRGIEPSGGFTEIASALGERLKAFADIGDVPLQEIADGIGTRQTALIIDGLDAERVLHPVQTFKAPKPGEPMMSADLLKYIAEEGSRKGTFVFAFVDNWRRCAVPCKELLNLFELRVAFCMNEDDAGALVSGGIGKFKGIEKPNRAVFVNRMTNEMHWFRPYVAATGGET